MNPNSYICSSFVVGYGHDYPKRPHHRSSTFPRPFDGGWHWNTHTLYGALVGGPDNANDWWKDDRGDYIMNEVATDYNAGFQGVIAGLHEKRCT